jgi:outer membrane protein assembly factor BamB
MKNKRVLYAAVLVLLSPLFADWPMWLRDTRGAPRAGDPPLRNPEEARPRWTSDTVLPPGRTSDSRRAASNQESPHSGGFASPMVADGVVYQFHYRPSGDVYDKNVAQNRLKMSQEKLRALSRPPKNNLIHGHDRWLIGATDILTAIDAETGKTLWQRDLGDGGINWNMFSKGGPLNTPAYADGRVFVVGTAGDVYAVDAKTGETLWTADIGPRAEQNRAYRREAEALREIAPRFRNDFLSSVVVADGVVLLSDQRMHSVIRSEREYHHDPLSGYIAFDAATGTRLWAESGIGGGTTPALWRHGGKDYLLASGIFSLSLREPKSGKALWKTDFGHGSSYRPAVGESHVVIQHRVDDGEQINRVSGCRIGLSGLELLWQWPADKKVLGNMLIHEGRGYALLNRNEDNLLCFDLETGKTIQSVTAPRLGGEQDNAMLIGYGDWLITANGKHEKGLNFYPIEPERMKEGRRFLPVEHATGYHIAIHPAFSGKTMFVRTDDRIEAFGW